MMYLVLKLGKCRFRERTRDVALMPKSKTSWVWFHFSNTSNDVASCNYCKKQFKAGSGTKNLSYHLENVHRDQITSSPPSTKRKASTPELESPKKKLQKHGSMRNNLSHAPVILILM